MFAKPQQADEECKEVIVAAMACTTFVDGLFVCLIAVTDQLFVDVVTSAHNAKDRDKVKKVVTNKNMMQKQGLGCFLALCAAWQIMESKGLKNHSWLVCSKKGGLVDCHMELGYN